MHYTKYCALFLLLIAASSLWAQVPVREEPHHKTVLENAYVRLLDVHIKPGDTTMFHIHAAPSVMVHITKSTITSQVMGEPPISPSEVLPGQTRFVAYDKKPVTHRVINAGNNVFHVMDIELVKKEPSRDSCGVLKEGDAETTINEKLVRVYRFDLHNQQTLNLPAGSCAHLLICVGGEINTSGRKITAGKYMFFNPNTKVSLNNNEAGMGTCVLLELK